MEIDANVSGSVGVIPNSSVLRKRVNRNDPTKPTATPITASSTMSSGFTGHGDTKTRRGGWLVVTRLGAAEDGIGGAG